MPKPPKLTLAAAEKVARTADPAAWDAMTVAERQALVDQVNQHHDGDHKKKSDQAKIDAYLSNPGMRSKRR